MNLTRNGLIILISVIFVAGAGTAYAGMVLPMITLAGDVTITGDTTLQGDLTCTDCIDTADITDDAITSTKIATDTITHFDIGTFAVRSPEIANGQVMTEDLANNAVTSSKIVDNAVTSSKIVDNAVTSSKIVDNAVTSSKIVDNTITASDISGVSKLVFATCSPGLSSTTAWGIGNTKSFPCTVNGLQTTDRVIITIDLLPNGLVIESAFVSSADTLTISITNTFSQVVNPPGSDPTVNILAFKS